MLYDITNVAEVLVNTILLSALYTRLQTYRLKRSYGIKLLSVVGQLFNQPIRSFIAYFDKCT